MARQAATDTPDVSVIVLVYNEVDSVEPLHRELMGVMEILRAGGYSRVKLVALEAAPAAAGPSQGVLQP